MSAGPAAAPTRPLLSVTGTLFEAWRLLLQHPREVLLPMFVVEAPVAAVSAAITAILYLSVFAPGDLKPAGELFGDGASGMLFAYLALSAFEALFAQVARGATIVSVAALVQGRPKSLTEALDPAFTRMGAILLLVVLLILGLGAVTAAVSLLALIPVVGLALAFAIIGYVALRTLVSFETLLLESVNPVRAIRRSWSVTRGSSLRLIGIVVLTFLAIAVPLAAVSLLGYLGDRGGTLGVLITAALTLAQGILVVPLVALFSTVITLYYLKARGLDYVRTTA